MAIKISSNFELTTPAPVDSRTVVNTQADLEVLLAYEGLVVYVIEEACEYIYKKDSDSNITWQKNELEILTEEDIKAICT